MKTNVEKAIAFLLIIIIVSSPFISFAYQPDTLDMSLYEIASVDFSTGFTKNITYSGARTENGYLIISGEEGESPAVNLNLEYETSKKNCYVDICYLDKGNFLFAVSYRNSRSDGIQSQITEGNNTNENIIKRIYLPDFCTGDGTDINIKAALTNPQIITGEDPLYIRSITLYTDEKETVNINAVTDKPGNIFYDGEAISFDASFGGTKEGIKKLDVKCNVYKKNSDMTESLYNSSEFSVIVDGASLVHYPLLLTVDEFALYTFELIASSDDAYGYTKVDFSKSLINKSSNPSLGVCVHLVRFGDADAELKLIKNAGFSTIRDDFTWWEYESIKGKKQLNARQKKLLDTCAKYDIEPLMIVYGNNKNYDITNSDLVSDEYMEDFKDFYKSVLELPEFDIVKRIEIWNEPSATYTLGGENIYSDFTKKGEQYAKILTAAYDTIKERRPDIKVGALSLSGMNSANSKVFTNSAMSYLSKNLNYQPFDAISYHPYLFDESPEYAADEVEDYNMLIEDYGFNIDSVWHTEYGYSTGNPAFVREFNAKTELEQAVLTLRKYAALKAEDNLSTSWIYDFADDAIRNNIENASHGLVNSRYSNTPYSAKLSYLAVSALNRLTSDAEFCEKHEINKGRVFSFNCPERTVYLMYNTENENNVIDFEIEEDSAFYYDIFGNALSKDEVTENGKFKMSKVPFYVVVGKSIVNQSIDDSMTNMPIMNISGNISSKLPDKNIAVIVLSAEDELLPEKVTNAKYLDQKKTGVSGTYDFNVRFENSENLKAYVISEDAKFPIVLNLHSIDSVDAVNLTSGMIKINEENVSMLDANNMSVVLNREYLKESTDYVVFTALYKNDELVFVGLCEDRKEDNTDTTAVTYNFSCDESVTYDKIKIFVWNSLNAIEPLLDARIYIK